MPRRPFEPGTVGVIDIEFRDGRYYARAYTRDAAGKLRRIRATGDSESEVQDRIVESALRLAHKPRPVSAETPIAHFIDLWLEEKRHTIRPQSFRMYRSAAGTLKSQIQAIPVGELDVPRLEAIFTAIRNQRSYWTERGARIILRGALGIAVRFGVIQSNPMIGLHPPRRPPRLPKALTVEQLQVLREVIRDDIESEKGRANRSYLWAVETMIATGLRIGEVLALRRMDVDLDRQVISVTGTLVDDEDWRSVRQDELKSRAQARLIRIPKLLAPVLVEALSADPSAHPTAPLFPSRSGTPIQPRNLRRWLRGVRETPRLVAVLAKTGLTPEDLTPHMFRRTVATLVAQETGSLSASKQLLGHSDERITQASYAGVAYRPVGDTEVIDKVLGRQDGTEPEPDDDLTPGEREMLRRIVAALANEGQPIDLVTLRKAAKLMARASTG